MSAVSEAFAGVSPAEWTTRTTPTDPRAETRRRIQARVCAACGRRRPAARRKLCAACLDAGRRYCPRCESIGDVAVFAVRGSYCRACANEWDRHKRGCFTPEQTRAARSAGGAVGAAAFRARTAAVNAEIVRRRDAGEAWPVVAAAVGLPQKITRNRYYRSRPR